MEKIIIFLLIVVIFLLLSEKFSLKIERKKPKNPNKISKTPTETLIPKQNIVGASKFVVQKQENTLTEAEKQAILEEFEEATTSETLDLEQEEEDLRRMGLDTADDDFATGLSFEELEKVADFLTQNSSATNENRELAQKVAGTNLLEEIEKALPEASLKVAQLLDTFLPKNSQSDEKFDIGEFV